MVYFLTLLIVGLLVGAETRSVDSSNLIEAIKASGRLQALNEGFAPSESKDSNESPNSMYVNQAIAGRNSRLDSEDFRRIITTQSLNLEKLLAEFAAKTVNVKDYQDRAAQWLGQLKLMLQLIANGAQIEKSKRENRLIEGIGDSGTASLPIHGNVLPTDGNNWFDNLLEYLDEHDIDAQSSEENESHVKSRYEDSSTSFSLADENPDEDDEDITEEPSAEELDSMLVGVQNDISLIRRYFERLCSKHHSMATSASHSESHNEARASTVVAAKKISKIQ